VATDPSAHAGEREAAELERLRARVDELERELAERTASAEAAVAAAQQRSYWADRLPFDLNAVMPTPLGTAVYTLLTGLARVARAIKRRLS
jgi:cell division septum initiation protein DivIVA